MAISPKVSSATVGATFTTIIIGIVGPHLFPHGMPADVQGLIGAGLTAAVTFASGWFAREVAKVEPEVKAVDTVFTKVLEAVEPVSVANPPAIVFQPGAGTPAVAVPLTPVQPR